MNFFGSTKTSPQTYEFYNPSALARQLAFGQLPIALCYADVIKPREPITNFLEWIRVAQLPPNADTDADLSEWVPAAFITQAYKLWWAEWKEHLFCKSALSYCGMIDPEYKVPDDAVSISNRCSILFFFNSISIGNSPLYLFCTLTTSLHRLAEAVSRLTCFHQAQFPQSATMLPLWLPSCTGVCALRKSPPRELRHHQQ